MSTFHDIEQNTPEWDALRCGKFGASTIKDLFATKSTDTYKKIIYRIAFERLTGEKPESFKSGYMERGIEMEAEAIEAFELLTFQKVRRGGFWVMDDWTSCSPDGLVTADTQIQIKCPAYSTQIDYILKGVLPSEYRYQMQHELMVTGFKTNIFFSYHPKLKPFMLEVERDEKIISEIKSAIETAKREVEQLIPLIK